ncbi:hypothetical protein LV84_01220 [Algoriphagus ratkowskyi]|uniref:TolB-like protein n=1 Tax=Algoriphagus ratkowskyi TaxID=57028 RepID=A0A2W7RFH9_9BACT|nr:hypothetical protein [Algoriphagus ratkowskyi]PZX59194.1 hypothetical protein LV84_01220 [Algoriphagus ratkowskyi]TXD77522.1 hypothetical protein ESW18_12060 [Algoriphagus ratkowskyi]
MKRLCLLFLIIVIFSCAEKGTEKIYQGKLEELLLEDFSLEKDSLTRGFTNLRVLTDSDNEYLVYPRSARSVKGTSYIFLNLKTSEIEQEITIPSESPDAMSGGGYYLPISPDKILAVNRKGWTAAYDSKGSKLSELKSELNLSSTLESLVMAETKRGMMYFQHPYIQIGQNPSHFNTISKNTGPGEMRSSFPLDFKSWLTRINVQTGEIENSDFGIPDGYEVFEGDVTATQLLGAYDEKRGVYALAWPYSEELYVLEGLNLQKKVIPKSTITFNFLPSEIIPVGEMWTAWTLPKEASANVFLLYDSYRDLNIRCSKIKESGTGETKFERTKHYILSIYSGEWEPKENTFLTSKQS